MNDPKRLRYRKMAQTLIKNFQNRHFDALYCETGEEALEKALSMIPEGSSVGWGGATSAAQIGLLDAVRAGKYVAIDRDRASSSEERERIVRQCFVADFFITGANAISLDGQMVNIDGSGNRVAAMIYGPGTVLVIAGMNKVCADLESAMTRARTVAAPINQQRFQGNTPCTGTGVCADCKSESCICNQIVITRHCRPAGRIKFILVGEDIGF